MAKNSITDYSKTAASNTDIQSVDIAEGCLPSGINNAIREIMADLADMNDGTVTLTSPSFAAASLTGNLSFGDGNKAIFGAGGDLVIQHNGGDSLINDVGTGSLKIQTNGTAIELNTTGGSPLGHFTNNGDVKLFYQGSEKFATTSTGIDVTGGITTTALSQFTDVNIPDNNAIRFGNSQDLQIYHDGSNSFVHDNGSGRLYLKANDGVLIQGNNNETLGRFIQDGAVQLYFNGSQKLATTSTGIDVTGNINLDDDAKAIFGAGSDLQIFHNSANGNSIIKEQGGGILTFQTNGSEVSVYDTANLANMARFITGGGVQLYHNGSSRFLTTATGINVSSSGDTIVRVTSADGNGAFLDLGDASDPDGGRIVYDSGSNLTFSTASTERVRIKSDGKVGIGTTSPARVFHIPATQPYLHMTSAATGTTSTDGLSILVGQTNGEALIIQRENQPIQIYTNGTERMRITNSGNVGIGTTSPSYPMTIHKTGDGIKFEVSDTVDANYRIQVSGSNIITGPSTSSAYVFQTGNTERVRITSAGLVGIGTSSPDGKLHIDGASDTVTGLVFEAGVTGDNKFIDFQNTSGDKRMGVEYDNNNVRLSIVDRSENKLLTIKEGDGNVGIGTTSPDRLLDIEGNVPAVRLTDTSVSGLHHEILGDGNSLSIEADDGNVGSGSSINFKVDGTERARLDSSGNLMVGGTISNPAFSNTSGAISLRGVVGTIEASRDGGSALELNRKTSDGTITNFRKDGTTVGSIGTVDSDIYIHSSFSGHAGLRFGNGYVGPTDNAGAVTNGVADLGLSTVRWKDLHLSGTANAGILNLKDTNSNGQINATESGAKLYYNVNDAHIWQRQGSEKARLDSSGNLLVGTTSAGTTGSQLRANGQVRGNSLSIPVFANRIGSSGVNIRLQNNSTTAGGIGTAFNTTFIYGTGGGVTDTGLAFANSQIVPCNGSGVGQDDVFDLGTSTSRFDDVFATNGTINTSDGDEKQDIEELTEAEQRVAVAVKGLLRKFRWKSRVEEKGDDARIHFGIIAQDLQAAFEAEGLDAGRYAMFINSTWTDEETGEERSRMGVRYNELLAFIIAAI